MYIVFLFWQWDERDFSCLIENRIGIQSLPIYILTLNLTCTWNQWSKLGKCAWGENIKEQSTKNEKEWSGALNIKSKIFNYFWGHCASAALTILKSRLEAYFFFARRTSCSRIDIKSEKIEESWRPNQRDLVTDELYISRYLPLCIN